MRRSSCPRAREIAAAVALTLASLACAKSDEEWTAELESPDPFARGLAAIALCEQAPELAAAALPVLLETVDRVELGLQRHAAAELAKVGPLLSGELVRTLIEDELMTSERREAVITALIAAGPRALQALQALAADPDPARRAAARDALALIEGGIPGARSSPPLQSSQRR